MTLQTTLSAQLDGSDLVSALLGELTDATTDLQGVTPALSPGDVGTASTAAGSINLTGIEDAIAGVVQAMGKVIGDLPVGADLIAPIRTGMTAINAVVTTPPFRFC